MSNMNSIIKQAALEAVEATKPCNAYLGIVMSIEPISIKIGDKLELSEAHIRFLEGLRYRLEENDRVLCIREKGGKAYYCIGRIS